MMKKSNVLFACGAVVLVGTMILKSLTVTDDEAFRLAFDFGFLAMVLGILVEVVFYRDESVPIALHLIQATSVGGFALAAFGLVLRMHIDHSVWLGNLVKIGGGVFVVGAAISLGFALYRGIKRRDV